MVDLVETHAASAEGEGRAVALITGGSAGIGLGIAREFAAHGHGLLLVARGRERLETAARELAATFPVTVNTLALDITAPDATLRIAKELLARRLTVAYLVNCAGGWHRASLRDSEPRDLDRLFTANVAAVHGLTRFVLPGMIMRGRGAILNVGSLAGMAPCPGFSLYAACKAFLHDMTLALRQEMRGTGVSVSLLAPGVVQTDFFKAGQSGTGKHGWLSHLQSAPQTVARAAYRGLMTGQAVIVPGLIWRLVWIGARVLPSRATARLVAAVSASLFDRPTATPASAGMMPVARTQDTSLRA